MFVPDMHLSFSSCLAPTITKAQCHSLVGGELDKSREDVPPSSQQRVFDLPTKETLVLGRAPTKSVSLLVPPTSLSLSLQIYLTEYQRTSNVMSKTTNSSKGTVNQLTFQENQKRLT